MFEDDKSLQDVISCFGLEPAAMLGYGGEAVVFALGEERALRVLWNGAEPAVLRARQELVDELVTTGAPFSLPELQTIGEVNGRWYSIERRLRGKPVAEVLATLIGRERDLLVEHYMEATAALGDLHLGPRTYWGEVIGGNAVRAPSWRAYLQKRAANSLHRSGLPFLAGTPERLASELAAALPEAQQAAFVHLDAFAGNVLAVGTEITSVIDIGVTAVAGDRRLDPLSGAVYLAAPQITPAATPRDIDVATSFLRENGLEQWLLPARDWLAAYWSFAVSDLNPIPVT